MATKKPPNRPPQIAHSADDAPRAIRPAPRLMAPQRRSGPPCKQAPTQPAPQAKAPAAPPHRHPATRNRRGGTNPPTTAGERGAAGDREPASQRPAQAIRRRRTRPAGPQPSPAHPAHPAVTRHRARPAATPQPATAAPTRGRSAAR